MNVSEEEISRIVGEVIAATTGSAKVEPVNKSSGSRTARAAVLVEPRKLEIREFPIREIGPDEILVKVEACGVCGTDVHCYKSDPFGLTPNVLGHEGTGEVVEVGHFVDGGECAINPHRDICAKEISLVGSWVYNSFEYPSAYHFLQRAERIGLPVSSLVTHKFPLDQIDEAFQLNLRQEGIKVVVEAQ